MNLGRGLFYSFPYGNSYLCCTKFLFEQLYTATRMNNNYSFYYIKRLFAPLLLLLSIPSMMGAQEFFEERAQSAADSTINVAEDYVETISVVEQLALLRDRSIPLTKHTAYNSWLPVWLSMPLASNNLDVTSLPSSPFTLQSLSLCSASSPFYVSSFEEITRGNEMDKAVLRWLQNKHPELIRETASELLAHRVKEEMVAASEAQVTDTPVPSIVTNDPLSGIQKILLPRRYWTFGWNSVLQFSQAYISANWHKGGSSNLNLYNKQLFKADYKRDHLSWNNELEWRLSVFTSAADTVGRYRVAEDLLRFRSNIGWESRLKNLYYTLDGEVRSQLFKMREENKTQALSDLASPIITTVGAGVKYVYDYKSERHYGRKLRLELNLAPIAYDFRWTLRDQIDLKRHGFKDGKRIYSAIGSMFRANLDFNITQSLAWQSRFFYNTSYKRIETEWENALIFALSKYFSTRLNVHLRFDDAVPSTPDNPYKIQVNQLFSFGFEMNI